MSNTIEGIWQSHYEYGKGANDEPQTSEHRIEFVQNGGTWVGTSLPNAENSIVTLTLKPDGEQFSGEWREQTSPSGHYQGREFKGLILLALDNNELCGKWLGVNSTGRVKSGVWTLQRV